METLATPKIPKKNTNVMHTQTPPKTANKPKKKKKKPKPKPKNKKQKKRKQKRST
jgi:hypothetical protein